MAVNLFNTDSVLPEHKLAGPVPTATEVDGRRKKREADTSSAQQKLERLKSSAHDRFVMSRGARFPMVGGL